MGRLYYSPSNLFIGKLFFANWLTDPIYGHPESKKVFRGIATSPEVAIDYI